MAGSLSTDDGAANAHTGVNAGADADGANNTDATEPKFGEPGAPLSKSAPFYRGFVGTLGVLAALLVGYAISEAESAIALVVISAFLAIGLNPLVTLLADRGVKRQWAVLGVAIVALAALGALLLLIGSTLSDQLRSLLNNAPHLLDDLRRNRTVAHFDARYHVISAIERKLRSADFARTTFQTVLQVGLSAVNVVVGFVVVSILTLYLLTALPQVTDAAYKLAPASRRERISLLTDEILHRVGRFVTGSVLVALIAGTVTLTFCFCVGLGSYALPLALLVAVLDLVPLVGSVTGAAGVCLVGFATSSRTGIICLLFYIVYETIEGYVIYPRVMRSSVDVPTYLTIVAVLLGGSIAGILGALLALPVTAALLLLTREVWVNRQERR